jgi:hypothetical protein
MTSRLHFNIVKMIKVPKIFFSWHWGLNSGPHGCWAGAFITWVTPPAFSQIDFISQYNYDLEQVFSLVPLLLLNVTGQQCEIQKRHRISRRTDSGIRCAGTLDGNAQCSLLLFSIILFIYSSSFLYLYSLRPYSFTVL